MVRYGDGAGDAGLLLAGTPASRIAMTKAVVGLIACQIAARHGW
jgi:hypothetical protein